ncbi:thioredoxin domain-containing protein [Georgenia sp. TF02-10]|uniref:DsbA family protein n=1 Tax=Georgenia sp. TF02-10 TaxID=2917725 RepID=UPI001FA810B2|nr:thioredoxin domain-containing protein [Georgenia sp. TF02-10]UNX54986.1 thioredoxin domain-containing protein [Georgenia sp. TF02-10]
MPAETTNRPKPSNRSRSSWIVPVAVLTVAAVLMAVIVWVNWSGTSPEDGSSPSGEGAPTEVQNPEQPDLTEVEARDEGDLLAAGPVDAPVVLVVFSDYQCSFCARWSEQTLPSMMEHVDAGNLRIEWRDVSVFGPASERAARASYAAALQGAFWEYHDDLFADGETRSEGDLSEEALVALAAELGLDTEQFAADLAAEETAQVIAANQQFGFDLGATSTPVFILGGQPIVGAQPTGVFEDAFQTALDAAE